MISVAANASMYAGHHPFQLGSAGVQVTADGRERHVDDRHVDHVHERPDDHNDRGEPAAGETARPVSAGMAWPPLATTAWLVAISNSLELD